MPENTNNKIMSPKNFNKHINNIHFIDFLTEIEYKPRELRTFNFIKNS